MIIEFHVIFFHILNGSLRRENFGKWDLGLQPFIDIPLVLIAGLKRRLDLGKA